MQNTLNRTLKNPGILAACCRISDRLDLCAQPTCTANEIDQWRSIFAQTLVILEMEGSNIEHIRVDVGRHVVNVRRQGDLFAATASVKGHPITKSLQRILRRILKTAAKGVPMGAVGASSFKTAGSPQSPSTPPPALAPSDPEEPSESVSGTPHVVEAPEPKEPERPW